MEIENIDKLRNYLRENINKLVFDSAEGADTLYLPGFDLQPRDYIEFVEKELDQNSTQNLINCISHLKRALDCQLDTFLYSFNLYNYFKEKNLKFDKKLAFLQETYVFSARSLSRLNYIRNKMEHEYTVPQISDIELYFDLVTAFIAVLERTLLIREFHESMEFCIDGDKKGHFYIKYNIEEPSIEVRLRMSEVEETIKVNIVNYVEFAYFFRVYLLIYLRNGFVSEESILKLI